MSTPPNALTLWDNGRLAAPRRIAWQDAQTRERLLLAAGLVASAVVLAWYVAVLEGVMQRSDGLHAEQRARAVAEAACENHRPAETRAACRALFDGADPADAVATAQAAPVNTAYAGATLQ